MSENRDRRTENEEQVSKTELANRIAGQSKRVAETYQHIGDNAFIGCNTNLVAPVRVGTSAYTAAGTTVTHDVPDGALAIDRGKQANIEGYATRKLKARNEKIAMQKKA